MTTGNKVFASDYNSVRNLAVSLIGTGSGGRGYGQVVRSGGTINAGTKIEPNLYTSLINDLYNIRSHQIGSAPALSEVAVQFNKVVSTDLTAFSSYANVCDTNRFTADSTRIATFAGESRNRTSSWNSSVLIGVALEFTDADQARYFFNAGGNIRLTSSRTGGSSSSQNTSWSNLLSTAGTRVFGVSNFYALTGSLTEFYSTTASSPYSSNKYTISARCDISSNTNGGAKQVVFSALWSDPYVDPSTGNPPAPDDLVDGTLTFTVSMQYPVGGASLSGGGNWRGFNASGTGGFYRLPVFGWSAANISGG